MNKTLLVILSHLIIILPIYGKIFYDLYNKKTPNKDLLNIAVLLLLMGVIYHIWYLGEYIYYSSS
jgi:hypothetical protein